MITDQELIPGAFYFLLAFYDKKLQIPAITTHIFIGKNIQKYWNETSGDRWFFQDPESYLKYGSFVDLSNEIETSIDMLDEGSLFSIYSLKGLISELEEKI